MSKGIFLKTKFSEGNNAKITGPSLALAKSDCYYPGQAYVNLGRSLQSTASDNDAAHKNALLAQKGSYPVSEELSPSSLVQVINFRLVANYPSPPPCNNIHDDEPEPPCRIGATLKYWHSPVVAPRSAHTLMNTMVKLVSAKYDPKSSKHIYIPESCLKSKALVDIKSLGFESDKLRNFMELAELRSIKQARKKKKEELLNNPAPMGEVVMSLEQYLAELAPPFTGHLIQTPAKPILQKKPLSQMLPSSMSKLWSPGQRPKSTPLSTMECTPNNFAGLASSSTKRRVSFAPNNIVLLYAEDPLERTADKSDNRPRRGSKQSDSDKVDESDKTC